MASKQREADSNGCQEGGFMLLAGQEEDGQDQGGRQHCLDEYPLGLGRPRSDSRGYGERTRQ